MIGLVLVGVGWCWLVLVGVGWCWLVLVGVGWCWLVLVGAIRDHLKMINVHHSLVCHIF
jgi:hypothetical protein